MRTWSVSEILADLNRLKITEDELKAELERTIEVETNKVIASSPLLLEREEARRRICLEPAKFRVERRESFQIGDRVYIDNAITPQHQIANSNDRKATVRAISGDRYFITTDNDFKTHRLSKYLRLLIEEDQQQ